MSGKFREPTRAGKLYVHTGSLPCQQHLRRLRGRQVQSGIRRRAVLKLQCGQVFFFSGGNLVVNLPSVSSWKVPAICRRVEA